MLRVHRSGLGKVRRRAVEGGLTNRARFAWLGAAVFALVSVVALWYAPRLVPPTGTLVVLAAGRNADALSSTTLSLHQPGGTWTAVGTVSGAIPAAPDQRQLLVAAIQAGSYDGVRLGAASQPASLTVTTGQVEPLLLGIDAGQLAAGSVYAGNDDVNLGLGELANRFVRMPGFELVDQRSKPITLGSLSGRDVVVAAFHTSCHETCPLYTALFLQLAKYAARDVMLLEVTTDTADTPSALENYAKSIGANWTFATGTPEQLTSFWKPFSVELSGGDVHTATLILVDRHGYVRLVYRGIPNVGHDIPPDLVTSLSARGLRELASGGDGWGAPEVLQALSTITRTALYTGGGVAPAFTLSSTDGSTVSLASMQGKPLVINFWATYCPPCKAEMPMLQKDVTQSGARLILINEGDGLDAASSFLRGLGIHQSALLDGNQSVGRAYGLSALPMTVFVRADGTVDRRQIGQINETVLAAELSNLGSQ